MCESVCVCVCVCVWVSIILNFFYLFFFFWLLFFCFYFAPFYLPPPTFTKLAPRGQADPHPIQMTPGHPSIHTTERHLGTAQDLTNAPAMSLASSWRALQC